MFNVTVIKGKVTNLKKEDNWNKYPYLGEPEIGIKYTLTIQNKKFVFVTHEAFGIAVGKELKVWSYFSKKDLVCKILKEKIELQVLAIKNHNNQITSLKFSNTKLLSFFLTFLIVGILFLCYNAISQINLAILHEQPFFKTVILHPPLIIFPILFFSYRPIMLIKTKILIYKEISSSTHIRDV